MVQPKIVKPTVCLVATVQPKVVKPTACLGAMVLCGTAKDCKARNASLRVVQHGTDKDCRRLNDAARHSQRDYSSKKKQTLVQAEAVELSVRL